MSLLEVQHLIDGVRSYMKEDSPRWRLDCSLIWLIVFSTEVNYFRENVDKREEVNGQI